LKNIAKKYSYLETDAVMAFRHVDQDFLERRSVDVLERHSGMISNLSVRVLQQIAQALQLGVARLQFRFDLPNLSDQPVATSDMLDCLPELDGLDKGSDEFVNGERRQVGRGEHEAPQGNRLK
jgi:hypothetical protein